MSRPTAALLADGRLHLQHGPIDLLIEAQADDRQERHAAYLQAQRRFADILDVLSVELTLLRAPVGDLLPDLRGPVAQRMAEAVWPLRAAFITPMAAVAGAVADEMLAALLRERDLRKAYVNNGGDIALHLAPGEMFQVGIAGVEDAALHGSVRVDAAMPVRGIATSGWRGRSFSLGIADSVTVLAANAAQADAAATLIANAVNIDDARIERVAANSLQPESDLGARLVTRQVPALTQSQIAQALDRGEQLARDYLQRGLIHSTVLRLQGRARLVQAELVVCLAQ